MLHYVCPTVRREIASGIGLDERTFQKTRLYIARVECAACGRQHRFLVADGWLESQQVFSLPKVA